MSRLNAYRMEAGVQSLQVDPKIENFAFRHADWLAGHPGKLVYSNNPLTGTGSYFSARLFGEIGYHDFYAENIGVLPVYQAGEGSASDVPFEEARELYAILQQNGCSEDLLAELVLLYWQCGEGSNAVLTQPAIVSCFFTGVFEKGKFYFVLSAVGNPSSDK